MASSLGSAVAIAMFPLVGVAVKNVAKSDDGLVGGVVWVPIAIQLLAWIVAYMGYGTPSICIPSPNWP